MRAALEERAHLDMDTPRKRPYDHRGREQGCPGFQAATRSWGRHPLLPWRGLGHPAPDP